MCGRAVKGEYDEAHPNKMQAADDLCSFFGVGLCSTREQLTGCHVLRKEALKLQDAVSEDLPCDHVQDQGCTVSARVDVTRVFRF